jgi:ABC-type polysaccharide/polyol phosphate transport system ATPase subunit
MPRRAERLHAQGRTILLVTHDMDQMQRFCDRALLLDRGHPVALGNAVDVTRRYLQLNFAAPADRDDVEAMFAGGDGDGSAEIVATWF